MFTSFTFGLVLGLGGKEGTTLYARFSQTSNRHSSRNVAVARTQGSRSTAIKISWNRRWGSGPISQTPGVQFNMLTIHPSGIVPLEEFPAVSSRWPDREAVELTVRMHRNLAGSGITGGSSGLIASILLVYEELLGGHKKFIDQNLREPRVFSSPFLGASQPPTAEHTGVGTKQEGGRPGDPDPEFRGINRDTHRSLGTGTICSPSEVVYL